MGIAGIIDCRVGEPSSSLSSRLQLGHDSWARAELGSAQAGRAARLPAAAGGFGGGLGSRPQL